MSAIGRPAGAIMTPVTTKTPVAIITAISGLRFCLSAGMAR